MLVSRLGVGAGPVGWAETRGAYEYSRGARPLSTYRPRPVYGEFAGGIVKYVEGIPPRLVYGTDRKELASGTLPGLQVVAPTFRVIWVSLGGNYSCRDK